MTQTGSSGSVASGSSPNAAAAYAQARSSNNNVRIDSLKRKIRENNNINSLAMSSYSNPTSPHPNYNHSSQSANVSFASSSGVFSSNDNSPIADRSSVVGDQSPNLLHYQIPSRAARSAKSIFSKFAMMLGRGGGNTNRDSTEQLKTTNT